MTGKNCFPASKESHGIIVSSWAATMSGLKVYFLALGALVRPGVNFLGALPKV